MAELDTLYPVQSFDGTPLNTSSGGQVRIALWVQRGLWDLPNVRGRDTILPGSAGRVARNRVLDYRTIELGGFVMGIGATAAAQKADIQAAMQELAALFDPTLSPRVLKVGLEDGASFARINARGLNLVTVEPFEPVYRPLSIELEAIDPVWQIGLDVALPLNAQLGTTFAPTIADA